VITEINANCLNADQCAQIRKVNSNERCDKGYTKFKIGIATGFFAIALPNADVAVIPVKTCTE